MRSWPLFLGFCVATLATQASAVVVTTVTRPDLNRAFEKAMCHDKLTHFDIKRLWSEGIFDAQVEAQALQGATAQAIPSQVLPRVASKFATKNQHSGYTAGRCGLNTLWVVSTPSSTRLAVMDQKDVRVNLEDARKSCSNLSIDYASAKGGKPRTLSYDANANQAVIHMSLLDAGTLSVTCKPMEPKWLGPMVWYLFPVNGGPSDLVPHEDILTDTKLTETARLELWVNAVRADQRTPALALEHPQLKRIATEFATKNPSIRHDYRHFRFANVQLKKLMARFVGENRVKATNLKTMAWLMWHSPQHRSMLLQENATHLSVALQPLRDETLAVLTFAAF